MPRKRKNKTPKKKPVTKRKKKLTVRDRKIAKLIVDSVWRVKTSDPVTTATGKETTSGWQKCKVISVTEDEVTVKYFDEEEDGDDFTYDIEQFIANADLAPSHVVDLTGNVQISVSHDQDVFVLPERSELLPLQKKRISDPKRWKKNQREFDSSWGNSVGVVPACDLRNCKLSCSIVDNDVIQYARDRCEKHARRGISDKRAWLSLFVRALPAKISDTHIWNNYVKRNVRDGRQHWSCSYCKCNPHSSPDFTIVDLTHRFKQTKKRADSKYNACPYFEAGVSFREKTIADLRAK